MILAHGPTPTLRIFIRIGSNSDGQVLPPANERGTGLSASGPLRTSLPALSAYDPKRTLRKEASSTLEPFAACRHLFGGCSVRGVRNAFSVRSAGGRRVTTPANEALARENETMRLELQEANRQLREATEQFQAMFEQGMFAARLRLDGTVIDINRAAVEVCGLNRCGHS
jgi:PAS domain-containing protein